MPGPGVTRVVLVDDSATVRAVLRRLFARSGDIEVIGEAADGEAAVELVVALRPDLVLMDIEMPRLDGFGATERIMAVRPTPILVLSSRANRDQMQTSFEALKRGALEVLAKPEEPSGWDRLARTLPETVRFLAGQRPKPARTSTESAPPPIRPGASREIRWVALGASTGGPGAIQAFLASLPADLPVTTLVVQHIAAGFEEGFAEWLARELHRDVQVATDGESGREGAVRVAPAGAHLRLTPAGMLRVDSLTPPRHGHRPSVDELFLSCAEAAPRETAGVLLTGMGADGAEGLAALRRAGGLTMVQDEATSVVFGMPRAAIERGAAEFVLPPRALAAALAGWSRAGRP
ncbi:MAG: chemotaxis-specific protein-glutamate methyltransferase CheB [Acidobacteriota bacterium]